MDYEVGSTASSRVRKAERASKKKHLNSIIQLRPRNLYLIKDTLQSFGNIQLPTDLDTLRRALYYLLIDKIDQNEAYEQVADEIIELYDSYGIDTIEKSQIVKLVANLVKSYFKMCRNQHIIDNLSFNDKRESKDLIIEMYEGENEYLEDLGLISRVYAETTVKKLSELKNKNGDTTFDFFLSQKKKKNTGLTKDPELRYYELLRKGK